MAEQGDLRLMTVYGYARLVAYNSSLEMQPDILLSYENDKNKVFTLHLRPGHKWSDGTPFTAEDFRFQWEDILTDKDMDRGGLDSALLAGGKGPKFEVIDELTVRYTWEQPNPLFLPALAGARPLDIYSASAYLKQFHAKYADAEKLDAAVSEGRGEGLDAAADPQGPQLSLRESRPADFAALAEQDLFARQPLRLRAQPLLSPGRPERRAAALCRSGRDQHRRKLDHSGQDGFRRGRPAGALSRLRRLHLPQGRREAQQLQGQAVDGRQGVGRGAVPEPERDRCRLARALPRRALPPGAFAGHRPDPDQPGAVRRPGEGRREHRSARQPALPRRTGQRLCRIRSRQGKCAARRDRAEARRQRHPADAGRKAARPDRRKHRREARWKPTCWNW